MEADANPTTDVQPTSVYRYFDDLDVLIYVGITKTGTSRNQQHNDDKEWWPLVTRQEVDHCDSREAAIDREKQLIQQFLPPFNIQHNPSHRQMRVAYDHMRLQTRRDEDVNAALRARGRKIRLTSLGRRNDGFVEFVTEPKDATIAMRLRHVPERFIHEAGTRRVGTILDITKRGPFAKITAAISHRTVCRSGDAIVKNASVKGPIVCEIRIIHLHSG